MAIPWARSWAMPPEALFSHFRFTWSGAEVNDVNDGLYVSNTNCTHGAMQRFAVDPDTTYIIEFTVADIGNASQVDLWWWQSNQQTSGYTFQAYEASVSSTGTYSVTITPTMPYIQVMFNDRIGCGSGNYFILDDISITTEPYVTSTTVGLADYRFGFNGMEKDDEVKGSGNSLDFGARIYDSRLGRFLSIDPKYENYPQFSSYLYAENNPIALIDRNGESGEFPIAYRRMSPYISHIQEFVVGKPRVYVGFSGIKEEPPSEVSITLFLSNANQINTRHNLYGALEAMGDFNALFGFAGMVGKIMNQNNSKEALKQGQEIQEQITKMAYQARDNNYKMEWATWAYHVVDK